MEQSSIYCVDKEQFKKFKANWPEIYAHSHHGGWRSKTVHIGHLSISYSGNVLPAGGEVHFTLGREPKLVESTVKSSSINIVLHTSFYVDYREKRIEIVTHLNRHLMRLSLFLKSDVFDYSLKPKK
jgi:hypothetical protein